VYAGQHTTEQYDAGGSQNDRTTLALTAKSPVEHAIRTFIQASPASPLAKLSSYRPWDHHTGLEERENSKAFTIAYVSEHQRNSATIMAASNIPPVPTANYPDLKGKVALVIGVGQAGPTDTTTWGNGAAIAFTLAQSGAIIFGVDLKATAAEWTASRIRSAGGQCDIFLANATSATDISRAVAACMSQHGRIDILINNVGMTASADPGTMSEDLWDVQFNLNLKSVFLANRHVLPIMAAQPTGGSIINNASIAGLRYLGKPQIAYATAKAAVLHYTRATACMYAERNVRMNALAPGMIYTPLIESLGKSADEGERETFRKITQHNVPMGRLGDAWDVANAAAYLASDVSRYVTGQAMVMDGGLTSATGTGFVAKL
jgi:NAD(P)-dependent dehydrogenase (short-subunit alcohol dehydrogenase family)